MVPTDDDHIRIQCKQAWDKCVHFFNSSNLGIKIPHLAKGVRFFHMQVEEIERSPIFLQSHKLIVQSLAANIKYLHTHKSGYAAIHPVHGNCSGFETILLLVSWQSWESRKTT